jgi:hypothetical protein
MPSPSLRKARQSGPNKLFRDARIDACCVEQVQQISIECVIARLRILPSGTASAFLDLANDLAHASLRLTSVFCLRHDKNATAWSLVFCLRRAKVRSDPIEIAFCAAVALSGLAGTDLEHDFVTRELGLTAVAQDSYALG